MVGLVMFVVVVAVVGAGDECGDNGSGSDSGNISKQKCKKTTLIGPYWGGGPTQLVPFNDFFVVQKGTTCENCICASTHKNMYKVLTLKWEGGLEQAKLAVKQLFLLNGFPKTDRRLTFNYYFVPGNNELRPGPRQIHNFLLILTKGHVGRARVGKQSMYLISKYGDIF